MHFSHRLASLPLRAALVMALALLAAAPARAADLVMVDREGCAYCLLWKKQIGPAYPNTDLGQYAPLIVVNIRDGAPEGVSFARPVIFTPTFILIENGVELDRIEGYAGDEFFWSLLERMLKNNTDFPGSG